MKKKSENSKVLFAEEAVTPISTKDPRDIIKRNSRSFALKKDFLMDKILLWLEKINTKKGLKADGTPHPFGIQSEMHIKASVDLYKQQQFILSVPLTKLGSKFISKFARLLSRVN
ncbi:unnamed protein product [Rhizopus stolonifer]